MRKSVQLQVRMRTIAEELEQGHATGEIVQKYTAEWGLSERSVERYIALAKDVVLERVRNHDTIIEAARGTIIAEEAEQSLRSSLELEARLVSVIEGGLEIQKVITKQGDVTEVKSAPSRSVILKAIDLLWKRKGIYYRAQTNAKMSNDYIVPDNVIPETEAERKWRLSI